MKLIFLLLIPYLIFSDDFKTKEISLSGKKLSVEIADNDSLRSRGLMHRTGLSENSGMLFIFDTPQPLSFWMKNTFIPLSIGYFDKNKILKEIHDMPAQNIMERNQNLKNYPSQCICQYALEVNKGWFQKNNIKIGAKLIF